MRRYFDENAVREVPNKYNLTPPMIRKLKIKDWEALKKCTWYNDAMKKTGEWWCHLEGCQKPGMSFDDDDEFWIGFRKEDNKVDYHFSAYEGMCKYTIKKFYSPDEIENKFDMQVQVNTLRWLNKMLDEGILALEE